MPKFLFWNIGSQPIAHSIKKLVVANNVDVLILAECPVPSVELLQILNASDPGFQFAPGVCPRLQFLTRFDSNFLVPLFENPRISIRRLTLPAREKIIVAAAHLPSKLHFSNDSLAFESVNFAEAIAQVEEAEGHRRTIVMGDLNMNPFEDGIIAAKGLNAVMSRRIALGGARTVQRQQYPFFYNPMWSHWGDRSEPVGTFYYEKAEHVCYYWNIFDQVLLRPDLIKNFHPDDVQILTTAGCTPLVDEEGRPESNGSSDHLPILLNLNF